LKAERKSPDMCSNGDRRKQLPYKASDTAGILEKEWFFKEVVQPEASV
jgi:hypothetical protein